MHFKDLQSRVVWCRYFLLPVIDTAFLLPYCLLRDYVESRLFCFDLDVSARSRLDSRILFAANQTRCSYLLAAMNGQKI